MKLLYDHQIFTIQNYGGISRYFSELMEKFDTFPDISFEVALRYSRNENLINNPLLNKYWSNQSSSFFYTIFPYIQRKVKRNLLNDFQINKFESINLLKKQDFDLFHPTYYDPYFLKYLEKKPFIITVYDMIHEIYPEFFISKDPTVIWKRKLIRNADSIIAISNNTKNDILKSFDLDPDMINVIYLGNPLETQAKIGGGLTHINEAIINKKYILFVGTRLHYKNFTFLISSIYPLFEKYNSLLLYCAGGGPFTPREKILFKDLNITSRIVYLDVNEHIMKKLYKNAIAFIFPSLYEGFGLPILEAFSCGCPVVTSNSSSLSEIGGDACFYFDPKDAKSIREAVETVITNNDYRSELIRKGNERIKLFSWENTARETKAIYSKIMKYN